MKKILTILVLGLLWCNVSLAESLKDQFKEQGANLISDLDREIKKKSFLKYLDRSWNEFEKYVLNYKGGDYGDIYTFTIPNVEVKYTGERIDIIDQFFKCSKLKSYRKPNVATDNIFFHTDGKFLVSSLPYAVSLVQSGKNIKLELTGDRVGIKAFDTLGSVNQKFIKSKCEDIFIELENPLKKKANVTDRETQIFYFKDVKSGKVSKDYIIYGWKMHSQFIAKFVKMQCGQVSHLSRSNEISKTEEAKKIKSKITNKIEQHKRYIIWALKKEEIRYKLDENNLCSNFRRL